MTERRTRAWALPAAPARRGGWRRGVALAALSLGFLLLATRPAARPRADGSGR